MEVIENSAIYIKKLKLDYLLKFYYFMFSKSYLKEKNTQKLVLVI